eukprot:5577908-Prymnesium_polylepis.1
MWPRGRFRRTACPSITPSAVCVLVVRAPRHRTFALCAASEICPGVPTSDARNPSTKWILRTPEEPPTARRSRFASTTCSPRSRHARRLRTARLMSVRDSWA